MASPIDWGSVPAWVAAVGTTGALSFTAVTVRRSANDRRRQQAAEVSAWWRHLEGVADGFLLEYRNASTEPAWNLQVWVTTIEEDDQGQRTKTSRRPIVSEHVLPPRATGRATVGGLRPAPPYTPSIEVDFSDAAGRRWHRDARGRLSTPGLPTRVARRARAKLGRGPQGC